jgi:hypothetical protein
MSDVRDDHVTDVLKRAMAVVEDAEVPDELRRAAFTAAVGLLAGATTVRGSAPPTPGRQPAGTPPGPAATDADPLTAKIAAGLGVEAAKVERVFAEKDGEPVLTIKSAKLPRSKAGGAHDIALLLMGARQASGIDEYTEAGRLRDETKRYGKFDGKNFGTQMKSLDNYILTDGKGAAAKRKLTVTGLEAAGELVEKYAEE